MLAESNREENRFLTPLAPFRHPLPIHGDNASNSILTAAETFDTRSLGFVYDSLPRRRLPQMRQRPTLLVFKDVDTLRLQKKSYLIHVFLLPLAPSSSSSSSLVKESAYSNAVSALRAQYAALLEHEAAARTTADEADTVRRLATAALSAERAWRVRAAAAAAAATPTSAPALPTGAASPSAASPSFSPSALPSSPSERRGARPSALSAAARFREAEAAEGLLQREGQIACRRATNRAALHRLAVAFRAGDRDVALDRDLPRRPRALGWLHARSQRHPKGRARGDVDGAAKGPDERLQKERCESLVPNRSH